MFCGKCGAQNNDGSKFCLRCGAAMASPMQYENQDLIAANDPAKKTALDRFVSFLKRRWMIVAPVLIVIIVGLFCLNGIIMMISPSYAVLRASKTTLALLDNRIDDSPLELFRILGESCIDGTIGTEFSYDDGYGTDVSGDLSILSSFTDNNYGLTTNISIDDENYDLTAFLNNDRLAFKSTLIDDKFYGITYDTFAADLQKFAAVADLDDDTIDALTKIIDSMNSTRKTDFKKIIVKYNDLLEQFLKDLKPVTASEQISVDGASINCKVVNYEITEDALDKLLHDFYTMLSKDKEMRDYLSSYLEMQGLSNAAVYGYLSSAEDSEELYDNMLSSLDDFVDSFKDEYSGTIKISYFVSSNKLIRFDVSGAPKVSGEKFDFEFSADFGKNPDKNNIVMNVEASDGNWFDIKLKATYQSENKSGIMTDQLKIKASSDGSNETLTLQSEWVKKTGDLTLALDASGDEFEIDGNLTFSNGGFKLVLDDLLDESFDMGSLDLIFTAHKGANISKPDYLNLDKWDEDFIDNITDAGEELSGLSYSY